MFRMFRLRRSRGGHRPRAAPPGTRVWRREEGPRRRAPSRWVPVLEPVVRPRAFVAQADPVPGMVRALVGVGRDALGRDLPARGLERRARLGGIDKAGLRWLPRRRSFPVLPGLFHRFHFVPKQLVFRAVVLDHDPVLPGRYHLAGATAPGRPRYRNRRISRRVAKNAGVSDSASCDTTTVPPARTPRSNQSL